MEDEQLTSIVVEGDAAGYISERGIRLSQRSAQKDYSPPRAQNVNFGEVLSLREILMRNNPANQKEGDTGEGEIPNMENSLVTR